MASFPFHFATTQELYRWAKKLEYFRVVASEGNDKESSDSLIVRLSYDSVSDYLALLVTLGVMPNKVNSGQINPLLVRLYGVEEGEKYESEIEDVPGYKQSGVCQISDRYVFLWAQKGVLSITISTENGPPDNIIESEVDNAVMVEKKLKNIVDRIIDPPLDSSRCFCPKFYPDAFQN